MQLQIWILNTGTHFDVDGGKLDVEENQPYMCVRKCRKSLSDLLQIKDMRMAENYISVIPALFLFLVLLC